MILKALIAIVFISCALRVPCPAAEPPITAIAFAPDGQSVVAGSQAGVVVYRASDLKPIKQLVTRVGNVHDLAISPDGTKLVIAGGEPAQEGLVEIVKWPSGEAVSLCQGHGDTVLSAKWLDNDTLLTASLDHGVIVWRVGSREPAAELRGHSRGVAAVCYLAGSGLIVSGGRDQNLRVWQHPSGELVRTLNNHTGAIHDIAQRPATDGLPMIASAADDRTVRLWQPTIGRMVRMAQLDTTPLALEWLPDGSLVAAATTDGNVLLIDPATVEIVHRLPAVSGWAYSVAVHPKGKKLLVGGRDGQLKTVVLTGLR